MSTWIFNEASVEFLRLGTGCCSTQESRCQTYTVTSIRRISLLRSVCELLSVSSSSSRCFRRLLSRSLSSWALSLSSEHDSRSFFRRDTLETYKQSSSGVIWVLNWKVVGSNQSRIKELITIDVNGACALLYFDTVCLLKGGLSHLLLGGLEEGLRSL